MKNIKQKIMEKYKLHETDTGSSGLQIALLTHKINHLNEHFKKHRKDFGSKRGLFQSIGHRSALLKYIKAKNAEGYQKLIKSLGIRK